MTLQKELESLLNRHCAENGSNTPDFILARYLMDCLKAFDNAALMRSNWYGNIDKTVEDHHRFIGLDDDQIMDKITEAVYQAVGSASMAWSETPKGVFDSTRCCEIADVLLTTIKDMTVTRSHD